MAQPVAQPNDDAQDAAYARLARQEQAEGHMESVASLLGTYVTSLVEHGLTREEAPDFAHEWHELYWERSFHSGSE